MSAQRFKFWLWWVLANTVGLAASLLACWLQVFFIERILGVQVGQPLSWVWFVALILVWPLGSALAQWLLLRLYLPDLDARWILATLTGGIVLVGATIFGFLFEITSVPGGQAIGWGFAGVCAGSAVGVTQRLVLLRELPSEATLWVPANAAGWGMGWLIAALAVQVIGQSNPSLPIYLGFAVAHILSAALTGVALTWILRHRLVENR